MSSQQPSYDPPRPPLRVRVEVRGQAVEAAVTAATMPLVAELARREETIVDKDATIERQAEELGTARERARRAQADADQGRAQLQAEHYTFRGGGQVIDLDVILAGLDLT